MGKMYGYIRVSSTDQNEIRQRIAMGEHGIAEADIYMDRQSGKDFQRPRYQALLRRLGPGDLLCVTSIDRLGRDYVEIQQQWRLLTQEKKVDMWNTANVSAASAGSCWPSTLPRCDSPCGIGQRIWMSRFGTDLFGKSC